MTNLNLTSRIGMITLLIGLLSSTMLFAKTTADEITEEVKSKDEIAVEKLIVTVLSNDDVVEFELSLEAEGIFTFSTEVAVVILNDADEVVYEGAYNGIDTSDKTLKKYMAKADLMMNSGDVAYYMLF
jgi:hypothetical protein